MSDEIDDRPLPPRIEDIPPERLVPLGGPVRKFRVTLCLFGDDLDPDEITRLLGAEPTTARRKGDRFPGRYRRSAKEGAWMLELDFAEGAEIELEQAINQLLDRLNSDPAMWANLNQRFRCDVACGLFLGDGGGNEGLDLGPETLRRLVERHLEIGFDLYY
jgi:hypothetical protein